MRGCPRGTSVECNVEARRRGPAPADGLRSTAQGWRRRGKRQEAALRFARDTTVGTTAPTVVFPLTNWFLGWLVVLPKANAEAVVTGVLALPPFPPN